MPSNAEQFYQKITAPDYGYDFLASLPERKTKENDWLEFKSASRIDHKNAVQHWSKALSGFANTSGGVLIWGLQADRNNDDGIDYASALALSPNAEELAQKLNDVLIEAVSPSPVGVQIKAFKKDGNKDGFVVCYVPEGVHKAYRAEIGDKQFYLRVSDKFVVPAASIIRAMFTPRAAAMLIPSLHIIPRGHHLNQFSPLHVNLCLRNEGSLTAHNIGFSIEFPTMSYFQHTFSAQITGQSRHGNKIVAGSNAKVNPEMPYDDIYTAYTDNITTLQDGFYCFVKVSCEDCAVTKWKRFVQYYDLLKEHRLEFEPNE